MSICSSQVSASHSAVLRTVSMPWKETLSKIAARGDALFCMMWCFDASVCSDDFANLRQSKCFCQVFSQVFFLIKKLPRRGKNHIRTRRGDARARERKRASVCASAMRWHVQVMRERMQVWRACVRVTWRDVRREVSFEWGLSVVSVGLAASCAYVMSRARNVCAVWALGRCYS